jgi:hypothetical protein
MDLYKYLFKKGNSRELLQQIKNKSFRLFNVAFILSSLKEVNYQRIVDFFS